MHTRLLTLATLTTASVSLTLAGCGSDDKPGPAAETPELTLSPNPNSLQIIEGGDAAELRIGLSAPAIDPVEIAVSALPADEVDVSPATVRFAAGESGPVTVAFTAAEDDDVADDVIEISISSSLGDQRFDVTIQDDDALEIVADAGPYVVIEGGSLQVPVRMNRQPEAPVALSVSSDNPALAVLTPSLVFAGSNWDLAQNIRLEADADADTLDGDASITIAAAGVESVSLPITLEDPDELAFAPSLPSLVVEEGSSGTIDVALSAEPSEDVQVFVALDPADMASIAPATLTFTAANWSRAQTLTVASDQDLDTTSEAGSVQLRAPGVADLDLPLTVRDDDSLDGQRVEFSNVPAEGFALAEGADAQLGMNLRFQPASDVTVGIASSNPAVAVDPQNVTFTPENFASAQQVTVRAVDDLNVTSEVVTLTVSSAATPDQEIAVAVTDDDAQSAVVSPAALTIAEGDSATFAAHLAFEPSQPVTVSFTSAGNVTISPASFTFDAGNYAAPQSIAVSALEDANLADETAQISVEGPGVGSAAVSLTITDDDNQAIVASAPSLTLTEGDSDTFDVSLAFEPASSVTVVAESSGPEASVAPASLTFTTQNWNAAQTVTVSASQDADIADESVDLTLSSAGLPDVTVGTTITDDDTLNASISRSSLSIAEGDAAGASFDVILTQQPASDVTVNLAVSDPAKASLNASSLTFTTSSWNVPQPVTVTAIDDANAVDEAVSVTVSASGLTSQTINVAIADDDVLDLELSESALDVDEGDSGSFTAVLTAEPQGNVIVSFGRSDARLGTLSPTQVTFTSSNWNTAQTVTLTTVQDADASDESGSITVSNTGGGFASKSITVNVTDDETQEVILSTNSLNLAEDESGGTDATFDVRLSALPLNPVTVVTLTIGDTTRVTLDTTNLVFTPSNYNQTQTIRATALHDDDLADETVVIDVTVGTATEQLTIDIRDDDVQVMTVMPPAPASVTLDEGTSSSGWMTVSLKFRPASNAVISATGNDAAIATIPDVSIAPSDFANATPIIVNGVSHPNLVTNTTTFDVEHTDENGTLHTEGAYTVDVDNVDTQTILVNQSAVAVTEEGAVSQLITVTLSNDPGGPVTVDVVSADTSIATVSAATLSFDTNNWNTGETFTVSAVADADVRDETVRVDLTSAGIVSAAVNVDVTDDDAMVLQVFEDAGGTVVADGIAINEADAATDLLWARLSNEPDADTTIAIASTDDVSAPAALVFTAANYGTLQPVSIQPLPDDDVADDTGAHSVTFSHDGSVHGISEVTVGVDVIDDDVQTVMQWADDQKAAFSPIAMNENDPTSRSFWISLEHEPAANLELSVASSDESVLTAAPATLTFTASDWSTPQEVTLNTVDEDPENLEDPAPPDVTIALASGQTGDEAPDNGPLVTSIAVTDDDEQSIVVESLPEGIGETSIQEEGPRGSFQVYLEFPPNGASDQVDITDASGRLSFEDASSAALTDLTFDDANFADPQTVYVKSSADDGNATTETVGASLAIAGEVSTTHDVRIVDDEIPLLGQASYAHLSGGTRAVERQNVLWGGTRIAFIGYDDNLLETKIVSVDRDLTGAEENELASSAVPTMRVRSNVIELDPTRSEFGFFLAENTHQVDYIRTDENTTSALTTQPMSLIGNAGEFSVAWNSTDGEYGFVYHDEVGDDIQYYSVTATTGAQANSTRLTSGTGVGNPNLHWIPGADEFLMLYHNNADVRCKTFERDGTLNLDNALSGFPIGGVLVSSVYDGTDVVAAYYEASVLKIVKIDPVTCSVPGSHVTIRNSPVVTYGTATDPVPMIRYNGSQYAIAYDYVAGQDQKIGLIVDDQLDDAAVLGDYYEAGSPLVAIDGLYPSVAWAGDRWVLRYYDPIADSVELRTGAFQ